ncbi:hypothetical protein CPB84DRAFT_1817996 [Gymnopilus junonius]|uniref:Uncharacterized protein n=1 Tax=Gymnopilus junonius TaxID=109634 RepID=A0A9P5N7X9_GYMJU|nr:hypothetical protein CPB84DRAFT_1817996 [Gymnopilus junonius]
MSYSIINLPPHLQHLTLPRYHTTNLLLAEIMPVLKEADVNQVQNYLCVLVNELRHLWAEGVVIKTAKYPQAHKLGGFSSYTFFCTKCWVLQDKKACEESFANNVKYQSLNTKTTKAEFVKQYAIRPSELSRLEYFNICQMIIIDPMHN